MREEEGSMSLVTPENAPPIPAGDGSPADWISMSQAGRELNMTRQNAHLMARAGVFTTLAWALEHTVLVASKREVLEIAAKRKAEGGKEESQ
jgi:hypothetical protein